MSSSVRREREQKAAVQLTMVRSAPGLGLTTTSARGHWPQWLTAATQTTQDLIDGAQQHPRHHEQVYRKLRAIELTS